MSKEVKKKCKSNLCMRYGIFGESGVCPKCETKINVSSIKKESDKRKAQNNEYKKIRLAFLKDNPRCAVTGRDATEIHHMKGRVGSLLTDTKYFLPVCRDAHQRIELNPEWAKENGYSLNRTK